VLVEPKRTAPRLNVPERICERILSIIEGAAATAPDEAEALPGCLASHPVFTSIWSQVDHRSVPPEMKDEHSIFANWNATERDRVP
jgi:hypothetical protein